MTWHPSGDDLRAFAIGEGEDQDFERTESHLRECKACVARLEQLSDSATVRHQIHAIASQETSVTMGGQSDFTYPRVLGDYELVRVIGQGGMGIVFLAIQHHPVRRNVALKVLKSEFGNEEAIRRFEFERQTLASLDHPRIAKLLDAGVAEGYHFFAMEWIQGQALNVHCDAERWTIDQRLELFADLCDTIQFAHRQAVIHRDLKPSNLLVSVVEGRPELKVIDFGIAKSVAKGNEQATMTRFGQVLGTWQSMSPEQLSLRPGAVDTRSDVYALGAVLYELLTGGPPLAESAKDLSDIDAICHLIRHQEPRRVSKQLREAPNLTRLAEDRSSPPKRLVRRVSGEPEWIAATALQKDPALRYQSAGELAQDVRRHLRGERLSIPSPSRTLAARKFVHRHRVAAFTGMLVTSALLIGVASFIWQSWQTLAANQELAARTYVAEIRNAHTHFVQGNFAKTVQLLETQIPATAEADLRGWEWHHLWSQCHPPELVGSFTYGVHAISDLAYSPDGDALAITQASSRCAAVLAVRTKTIIAELNCNHRGTAVTFTPDGTLLAVACNNGELYVWDYAADEVVYKAQVSAAMLRGVAISPDGRQLVACGNEGLFWWQLDDLRQGWIQTPTEKFVTDCKFSPDGKLLVVGDRTNHLKKLWGSFSIYDASNRKALGSCRICNPGQHQTEVRSVAFSGGNEQVLVGTSHGLVARWQLGPPDPESGKYAFPTLEVVKSIAGGAVSSVKESAESSLIAFGANANQVQLWDSRLTDRHGRPLYHRHLADFRGHSSTVAAVDFCPHSGVLATADGDGLIRFWRPDLMTPTVHKLNHKPRCIALDRRDRLVAIGTETGEVRCRQADDFQLLFRHDTESANVVDVEFLPDRDVGRIRIAAVDENGKLIIVEQQRESTSPLTNLPGRSVKDQTPTQIGCSHSVASHGPYVRVAYDAAEDCLWLGGRDGRISRMSSDGRIESAYSQHEAAVFAIEVFPSADAIVTVSVDRRVKVCTKAGRELHRVRPDFGVREIAISPDERYLAMCGESRKIVIYDMLSRRHFELAGHSARVMALKFSEDGSRLASGGADGRIRLWQTTSWREVFVTEPTGGWVIDLDFDVQDERLIAGCSNDLIKIWQAPGFSNRTRSVAAIAGKLVLAPRAD